MITGVLKAKGFNWLTYALMGIQLLLLLGITIILVSSIIPSLGMSTIISAVIVFMLGLPLLVLLYISSVDSIIKKLLLGQLLSLSLLSLSGILWYILADKLAISWLVPLAKIIMVTCYIPMVYVLYDLAKNEYKKLGVYPMVFLVFVNSVGALLIIYYTVTRFNIGHSLDIGVYFLALLGDIAILALTSMLVILFKNIQFRYLLSIIFIYNFFSLAGDSLNLSSALQINISNASGNAQFFYDAMLVFLAVALLIYSIFRNMSTATVEEINKKLFDTRHAMDDLIMQMPDATSLLNPDGVAITVNDQFLRTFGVTRENSVGKFNLFKHAKFLSCEMSKKIPLLKKGEAIYIDQVKVDFPGDRTVFLSMKIFPTFSRDGSIYSFISISEDITARVQAEGELKQAKALTELYIDLISHDINNMNQVGIGYLEIALNTLALEGDEKSLLVKPLEAMMNSSRLIDNVKKLRRASMVDPALRSVDLGNVLRAVVNDHGQAPGRQVSIDCDASENTLVKADELLKDVFANLVSNAIKHSGGIVNIRIKQDSFDNGGRKYYRVTVEDNGPGIPDEIKPVVFDRLRRGRSKSGGSGIGLYLAKALIDSYGGKIAVEDRVAGDQAQGTRFIVTLPAVSA